MFLLVNCSHATKNVALKICRKLFVTQNPFDFLTLLYFLGNMGFQQAPAVTQPQVQPQAVDPFADLQKNSKNLKKSKFFL